MNTKPRGLDQRAIKTAIAVCEFFLEATDDNIRPDIFAVRVEVIRVMNLLKEMDTAA